MSEELINQCEKPYMNTKTIQTKVIQGKGIGEFFLEVDFNFCEEPFFKIEDVNTWVDVYDTKVMSGNKVVFNAWIYKSVVYETIEKCNGIVEENGIVTLNGILRHKTKRIPMTGFIDISMKNGETLKPHEDIAEVLNAYVSAEVEEELLPEEIKKENKQLRQQSNGMQYSYNRQESFKENVNCNICDSYIEPIYKYRRLHEKMCVRIEVKVVRWEHITLEIPKDKIYNS